MTVGNGKAVTKGMAITGSVLLLLPLPLAFASVGILPQGLTWMELLAVAAMDLTPAVLVGGSLLMWAALRARSHARMIGLSLALSASVPVAAVALNAATAGRALEGESWYVAIGAASFWLGATLAGLGGLLLLRRLFSPVPMSESPLRG